MTVLPPDDKAKVAEDIKVILQRGDGRIWINKEEGTYQYPYKTYLVSNVLVDPSCSPVLLNLFPALDAWIASPKSLVLTDTFHSTHLSDLYVTLPTRGGTRGRPPSPPVEGTPLGYGHHLVFFHPRNPEALLRTDGTGADFCPPEPFARRMWAGGTMTWNRDGELKVGEKATAVSTVAKVEKKGFEVGKPMVFVNQRIQVTLEGRNEHASAKHFYGGRCCGLCVNVPKSEFPFSYTPTSTTLFRFSALRFNGHHIHLDKDYAQKIEGYPERLVHGPLTALMLLETLIHHRPRTQLRTFTYRAHNPMIASCAATIHGAIVSKDKAELWCESNGVVGMTDIVQFDE
ncbi:hypothetical protein K503DRAFT_780264 [Rhizopogon vinicolor AM-OR11-026]|uniref:Uncharacterized protein n=1 Tax=Rhizopogon vinicolor AM-OR11-026 TaxID=1314800 RepID=A0A1B7NAT1_9AGAM|nr:hypothetical protein K503DRAFT_780264 [Rhizopogon vinicolor AM-OR11-026]